MNDLTFTHSGEFMLTSIQAETDEGVEFVDAWNGSRIGELIVVDSGWIIVKHGKPVERAALNAGLTIDHVRGD